jgi:hypothetical protein
MNKLKLDLEKLTVESFDTDGTRGSLGTVHAHAPETYVSCPSVPVCQTYWSCEGNPSACDWVCSHTMNGTCPGDSCSCPGNTCTCP